MSQADAYQLLSNALTVYEAMGFSELQASAGQMFTEQICGSDGAEYIIEVSIQWTDQQKQSLTLEGMVAVAGSGPLRRLDRTIVIENDAT